MGWEIPWYTITDDFDADFGVDEWHGTNAFYRDDEDRIFRTYFIDKRGDEALGSAWAYLDITALGRQEKWEDSPEGYPQTRALRVVEPPRRVRRTRPSSRPPSRTRPTRSAARGARAVIPLAHVGGVPVEELLPWLAGPGTGCWWRGPGSPCTCDADEDRDR